MSQSGFDLIQLASAHHNIVVTWKRLPYWLPFVSGFQRLLVGSLTNDQWSEALMFSLLLVSTGCWKKSRGQWFEPHWRSRDDTVNNSSWPNDIFMPWKWLIAYLRQAIVWNNADLLSSAPLGTNFSKILNRIYNFSFSKMHINILSSKRRPFCSGLKFQCVLESSQR